MSTALPSNDVLLAQAGWMRALARELVRDPASADDLTQDALLAGLARPAAAEGKLAAWLKTVLRNRARERGREEQARRGREARAARPEALPGTSELVERVQIQRLVAGLVLELDEPYRTTLLLRFWEELPPREIAARLGVPVTTVKSRLARGMGELRTRLDREHGGERELWLAALAPWLRPPMAGPVGLGGSGLAALGLGATVVLLGVLWLVRGQFFASGGAVEPGATPVVQTDAPGATAPARDTLRPAQREPLPTYELEVLASGAAEPAPVVARGRVLDEQGRPAPGTAVQPFDLAHGTLRTGLDGRFELALDGELGESTSIVFVPGDPSLAAVYRGLWRRGGAEALLVVAPTRTYSGVVRDASGAPVPDVRVRFELPEDLPARLGVALDTALRVRPADTTDGEGRFRLLAMAVPGSELVACDENLGRARLEAPESSSSELELVLVARAVAAADALRGRVLRADGRPAARARVALGLASARCDAAGAFVLDRARAGAGARELIALEPGALPARHTLVEGAGRVDEELTLVLGGQCLSISGRVVDAGGAPQAGARVLLLDPTPFGVVGACPVRLEPLLAGRALPEEALESFAHDGPRLDSARPARRPDALVDWVETDFAGGFTLAGLEPRDYHLAVLGPKLAYGMRSEPVAAGTSALVLTTVAASEELAGQVVTPGGDPVPEAELLPYFAFGAFDEPFAGGRAHLTRFFEGAPLWADAEGRFHTRVLGDGALALQVGARDTWPTQMELSELADPRRARIVLAARSYLEIELLEGPEQPDGLSARDAAGTPLSVQLRYGDGYGSLETYPLAAGRSALLSISSDVATLEFLRAGEVLRSISVAPRPGETLRLRL